jgi:hypothetical protein
VLFVRAFRLRLGNYQRIISRWVYACGIGFPKIDVYGVAHCGWLVRYEIPEFRLVSKPL